MTDPKTFDWGKYVSEHINGIEYCCIATTDSNGKIWTNPLWFAFDEKYSIYFLSRLDSYHMINIASNGKIAASIYSTASYTDKALKSIQLYGTGIILPDDEVEEACKIYYSRTRIEHKYQTEYVKGETSKQHIGNAPWKFAKIIPTELWYFDDRFFDEERQLVPKDLYT